ncbi:MAG: hypothetical protein MJ058_08675 [Akkermansia sp.]|nr:hypothetical protein [Akkermansia sp.]
MKCILGAFTSRLVEFVQYGCSMVIMPEVSRMDIQRFAVLGDSSAACATFA